MDESTWPLFGLTIATPRLTLRLPTDGDLPQLIEAARKGIHNDEPHPFLVGWTLLDEPEFTTGFVQFHWRSRAELTPDAFNLPFAVEADGELIGLQAVEAKNYRKLRVVETGSWLTRAHQGKGYGKEMRLGVLQFAFECLGAATALSTARVTNTRSLAVSKSIGYRENGLQPLVWGDGSVADQQHLRLDRDAWETAGHDRAVVQGWDRCKPLFALD